MLDTRLTCKVLLTRGLLLSYSYFELVRQAEGGRIEREGEIVYETG